MKKTHDQFSSFESWIEDGAPVYLAQGWESVRDKWSLWRPGPIPGVLIGSGLDEVDRSSAIAGIRVLWEAEGADLGHPVESGYQFWSNRGALIRVQAVGLGRAIRIATRIYGLADRTQYAMWFHGLDHYSLTRRAVPMMMDIELAPDGTYLRMEPSSSTIAKLKEPPPAFPDLEERTEVARPDLRDPEPDYIDHPDPIVNPSWIEGVSTTSPVISWPIPHTLQYTVYDRPLDDEETMAKELDRVCNDPAYRFHDSLTCSTYRMSVAFRERTEDLSDRALDALDRLSNWLRGGVDNRRDED